MRLLITSGSGPSPRTWVVHAPADATTADLVGRLPDSLSHVGPGADPLRHGYAVGSQVGEDDTAHGSVARVVVGAGPDAGSCLWLPPGRWMTVGRDPLCDLAVNDAGMSRRHLRLRHGRDGFEVEDLGSTNGTQLPAGVGRGEVPPGSWVRAGGTLLRLEVGPAPPASGCVRDGRLQVRPWARPVPGSTPVTFTTPPRPEPRTARSPSAWGWALPLVAATAAALLLDMPLLLVFGLLGPVMVLGQHLGDRRSARQEHREAVVAWREECGDLAQRVDEHLTREREARWSDDPGVAAAARALLPAPTTLLWDRGAEVPRVVVGEGAVASGVKLDGVVLQLRDAPVTLRLDEPVAVVGRAGPRDALVRSWILQLAVSHPPSTLALVVDGSNPPQRWDLLAWLPHTVAQRRAEARHTVAWGTDLQVLDDPRDTPPGVTRVLVHDTRRATVERPGQPPQEVRPTLTSPATARVMARRLAGVQEKPGPHGAGARTLGDLLPWPDRAEDAVRTWLDGSPGVRLAVPVGTDATGAPAVVDLARDGPHALVAGTTGSGKSELLRTLVTGLALLNRPSRMTLLLIDYKGGSSLGECAGLPHSAGLVTDLDPHLAERVLASLRAELRRREAALAAAGVRDVRDFTGPGLPRLVVVVDEFRVLAEELPDFLSGMVRVAAVGRSLGLHVVLATQRPAGIVTSDLRANVNLRVALRVRDVADSHDVLETPEAAHLPEGRPGQALLRTGGAATRRLQVAPVGPPSGSTSTQAWSVHPVHDVWEGWRLLQGGDPPEGPTGGLGDLPGLLTAAAATLDDRAPQVWSPPLPSSLRVDELPAQDTGPQRPWALADRPDRQRREPVTWEGRGPVAVVGAARTGRSTALASLALAAGPAWLYVLDPGDGLGALLDTAAPAVRAWVPSDDRAHGTRVLEVLNGIVDARRAASVPPGAPVVVLLDGWDRWVEEYAEHESGRGVDLVLRLLREGPAVGVGVALTGDRSLLVGRSTSHLAETWALRLNDSADLALAGVPPAARPHDQPPGRVVRTRDGVVAQVLLPTPTGERVLPQLPHGVPPPRVVSLPRDLAPGTGWAVGGDEARPVPVPTGSVVVLGPPRSGVSTTLGRLLVAAEGAGPTPSTVSVGPGASEADLARDLTGEVRTVLVDDAHLLAGTAVEELVLAWAGRTGGRLLVGGDADACATLYRGLVPHVARGRTGVLLQPSSASHGTILGVRPPLGDVRVPGRGVLVERGRTTRIQVAGPARAAGWWPRRLRAPSAEGPVG